MDIITAILILLSAGLVLGQIFEHYDFASVAGEIIGGIVLGPAVLDFVRPTPVLLSISEVALFFIVLLIGIEMTTDLLKKSYARALPLTTTSFLIPLFIMSALMYLAFGMNPEVSIIIAISIGVPSISIASVLVRSYGLLQTSAGSIILASVVISDLLAFLIFSSFLSDRNVVPEVVVFILFVAFLFYLDYIIARNSEKVVRAFERLRASEHGEKIIFGMIILSGLLVSTFFQYIGITYVLGAFFSGMLISEVVVGRNLLGIITRTMNRINESFFIPLYFTIIGLSTIVPGFDLLVVLAVLLAVTGGFSAFLNRRMSTRLGLETNPSTTSGILGGRGAVGVVIASLALSYSLIDHQLYSVVIFGTVIQALVLPMLIRKNGNKIES
ncbi:MAG: cation:proton antiporter [Candidatus Thermoplasmatota archaeon]|nr:cation:proton antiporter [Candidatus Sysuiplasma jiujiangense]MBX8639086.1 cation:proton antiporter [Candidatus Sysuiplasma jiujiangense]MCL4317187.1 cation:proton antiporter [Candidatus Thermoplasmatota archaeon]MCL5254343.1 cation:proton antiporter [Candidatus Thermoplasmatota archaeon]